MKHSSPPNAFPPAKPSAAALASPRGLAWVMAALLSLTSLWFCQSPEDADKVRLAFEADAGYQDFGEIWVGVTDASGADTLLWFQDSLADLDQVGKLLITLPPDGKIKVIIRGYASGTDELVYVEERVFDLESKSLVSTDTLLDKRLGVVVAGTRPVIVLAFDSVAITIKDTVRFKAKFSAPKGRLRLYAWDFVGTDSFDPALALTEAMDSVQAKHAYPDAGVFMAIVRVMNDRDEESRDTVKVTVLLDPPVADAGGNMTVLAGETLALKGKGEDGLGSIVSREWKIGDGVFIATADGGLEMKAPDQAGEIRAIFKVTDDDGQVGLDTLYLNVIQNSNALLAGLSLVGATLSTPFDKNLKTFAAKVAYSINPLEIRIKAENPKSILNVAGTNLALGDSVAKVPLQVGSNSILITVTAENGVDQKTYELQVTRAINADASLKALVAMPASLEPAFHPDTLQYHLTLANNQESLTLSPTASDAANAKIMVNGQALASGATTAPIPMAVGIDTVSLVITAHDGLTTLTYAILVARLPSQDATLKTLLANRDTLRTTSSPQIYADTVPHAVTALAFLPLASSPNAVVKLAGKAIAPGAFSDSLPLAVGDNSFPLVVVAQNGDSGVYRIQIRRRSNHADLMALQASPAVLEPAFAPGVKTYADTVAATVAQVSVFAKVGDSSANIIQIQGDNLAADTVRKAIALQEGVNVISITVKAEDGNTAEYKITLYRKSQDASLKALALSSGALKPAFSAAVFGYGDTVAHAVTGMAFKATPTYAMAKIKLAGKVLAAGSFSDTLALAVGDNHFSLVVVAESGDSLTYQVKIRRRSNNADLAALRVSQGILKPAFAAATVNYADTVGALVSSLSVTALVADKTGDITKIGSSDFSADSVTSAQAIAKGLNSLAITVKAEDGNTRVYTVTVYRPITFMKTVAAATHQGAASIIQTLDGGYALTGFSQNGSGSKILLMRTDSLGNTLSGWPQLFGSTGFDSGYSIAQASNRDLYVAGTATSFNEDGDFDHFLLRANENGLPYAGWPVTTGNFDNDLSHSLTLLPSGGLVSSGMGYSTGQGWDLAMLRVSAAGLLSTGWPKYFGTATDDIGYSVITTSDKGYLAVGHDNLYGPEDRDIYMVRTDSGGIPLTGWPKSYDYQGDDDIAHSVRELPGGGFVIAGSTKDDGGGQNALLLRLNANGTVAAGTWPKTFGAAGDDAGLAVHVISDTSYVLLARLANSGTCLIKTNGSGVALPGWPKTVGDANFVGKSFQATKDGGFIVAGHLPGTGGGKAIYLVKTDAQGDAQP